MLAALVLQFIPAAACAWDSATHRLVTRMGVHALPAGALRTFFELNLPRLERLSVEPDSKLKALYGKAEERRHYIDGENYGEPLFSALVPNLDAMKARFGTDTVDRSGTLPWTIDQVAAELAAAERRGECINGLRLAGYLSHYAADATQPLHSTVHFDGFQGDEHVHARFEAVVDRSVGRLELLSEPLIAVRPVTSVWTATIEELRHSHTLVNEVLSADRAARAAGDERGRYDAAMMREQPMVAAQLARAASLLASIWVHEWQQAGSPTSCQGQLQHRPPHRGPRRHSRAILGYRQAKTAG